MLKMTDDALKLSLNCCIAYASLVRESYFGI